MDFILVILQEIEECIGQVSDFFSCVNDELEDCLRKINDEVSNQFNLTIDIERKTLKETEEKIIGKLNLIHKLHCQLKSLIVVKGYLNLSFGEKSDGNLSKNNGVDLFWPKATIDNKQNDLVPILNRINGLASSMSSGNNEICDAVMKTLIKSQNGRNGHSEKSTFIVELNGDNGTMVSFKILKPSESRGNIQNDTYASLPDSARTIKSVQDKVRKFECKEHFEKKNGIDDEKIETHLPVRSETDIQQNELKQTGKNQCNFDEKRRIFETNPMKNIALNNGSNGIQRKIITNSSPKRVKSPSFPSHEKICQRFQLENINGIEATQISDEDSEFRSETGKISNVETAKDNVQNETTRNVDGKKESDASHEMKSDSNNSRIYKPWLMFESTNDGSIEEEDNENDDEAKMDCRYLTPDYKPSSIHNQGKEQQKIEKRLQKSLKQLIVPHKNTYSSFETKVVDGLRQVVADKSNIDAKNDDRATFSCKCNCEKEDSFRDNSLVEQNQENASRHFNSENSILRQNENYPSTSHESEELLLKSKEQNIGYACSHSVKNQLTISGNVYSLDNDSGKKQNIDLGKDYSKIEGRRYLEKIFENNENQKNSLESYNVPPKNGLNGVSNSKGPRFVVPCRNTILGCTRKVITRTGEILDDHYTNCPYDYIIAPNTYGNCIKIFLSGGDSSNGHGGGNREKLKSELVYIFQSKSKKNFNEITSISSEIASSFPGFDVFGGSIKGRTIVGNQKCVLEYNTETHGWSILQNAIKDRKDGAAMCSINDSTLVLAGGEKNGDCVEVLTFYGYNSTKYSYGSTRRQKSENLSSSLSTWSVCDAKLPVPVSHHTLIRINNRRLMLVGGIVNEQPSNRVFEGIYYEYDKNITWKERKPLKRARQSHITFRLGHNIYSVGGQGLDSQKVLSCCEVYNLHSQKWIKCLHKLPFPLYEASVVVDPAETFAVITGNFSYISGASNSVIIFTELNGFSVFNNFTLKIPRFGHVSSRVE